MKKLLWAERNKLHNFKIIRIAAFAVIMSAVIVFAEGQFTYSGLRYVDGAGWFMSAAQSLGTFFVLPAIVALLGSYMICREEQEDVMKSLRLVPIDEVKLTVAKMIIALVARIKMGYLPALIFAETYSFAGLFTSMSETLKTVYPITAVFKLSRYYEATIRDKVISLSLLFICAVFAIFILAGLDQRQLSAGGRYFHES